MYALAGGFFMSFYYSYKTRKGIVKIVPVNGRYNVIYDEQDLGSYHSPVAAADDVSGGYTFMPSCGTDLGELDISSDIGDWDKVAA
jgi:hypothetical protein